MASGARVPVGEMQDAYLEFFQSVERAGETIAGALGKLRERWPVSCQASQSAQVSLRA
jgi:hypothetical protein